jgi:hypothetical protein
MRSYIFEAAAVDSLRGVWENSEFQAAHIG